MRATVATGDDQRTAKRRALVLAGGGYAASAWEIGLVTRLADAGLDVRNADIFVGTSAGADVATGFDRVLILSLRAGGPSVSLISLDSAVAMPRAGGTHVEVIHPDEDARAALAQAGGPMSTRSQWGHLGGIPRHC